MTHVVCVGDVMVDVVAALPGPLAPGSDTPAPISIHGGGAAANVAAWLTGCRASATFVGRIGDDPLGRRAVEDLTALGVDVRVSVDPDRPTGTCIVLVASGGERTMIPSAGANAGRSDLAQLPEHADWLYLSGYALLGPDSRPSALESLAVARDRGWSIAIDAASAAPLASVGAQTFLEWVGADVLLLANTDESLVLTGIVDPGAAAHALAKRCGQAIVKCGPDGAVWSDGSATRSVPAERVRVVDTTGAGDAFTAGFLAGDGDISQKLMAATRVAACAIGHSGARPA
jgi:sugar/nucleoside kinase (ribokinase family)